MSTQSPLPDWLSPLREDPRAPQNLRWLNEQERAEQDEAVAGHYAGGWPLGVLWTDALWEAHMAELPKMRAVATGPSINGRQTMFEYTPIVFTDGEQLYLALCYSHPTYLWLPCGRDLGELARLLKGYTEAPRLKRAELPRVHRACMGFIQQNRVPNPYSGELVAAYPHDLQRHWTFSPFADTYQWGSAFDEDPWEPSLEGLNQIDVVIRSREYVKQGDDEVCSFTRSTVFSHSYFKMELHRSCLWVMELRYDPSLGAGVSQAFNERFGGGFPPDLPVDLFGAILGFYHYPAETITVAPDEESFPVGLQAYTATICHDLGALTDTLRRYAKHPNVDVRAAVQSACITYNLSALAEELWAEETDEELLDLYRRMSQFGVSGPRYDEQGEPPDLYPDEDEDEDDDDDDDGDDDDSFDDEEDEA
jgi:hypothetical protein